MLAGHPNSSKDLHSAEANDEPGGSQSHYGDEPTPRGDPVTAVLRHLAQTAAHGKLAGTNGHREEAAAKLLDSVVRAGVDREDFLGYPGAIVVSPVTGIVIIIQEDGYIATVRGTQVIAPLHDAAGKRKS